MSSVLAGSYQPFIQGSILNVSTTYQTAGTTGFEILMKAVAPNAFHNSDDRPDPPKCHEKTRIAVINKIMDWITGKVDAGALMLWLYGPAGVGKSAIARTIAELCEAQKPLLASFFFFRSNSTRNTMKPLVANIAYRIACVVPAARRHIEMAIEADPLLLSCSLETQFAKLVVGPLQALAEQGLFSQTPLPPLILIDGLDECLDRTSQMKLIQLLSSCQLPLKFLIASRPEQDIKFVFASISTKIIVSHLELNDDFNAYEDIRLFLTDRLSNIKQHHPFRAELPASWPREGQIASLVQKSCGQFIYASLVARFVDSPRHLPAQRLDIVLGIRPPVHRDLPFAELDALYTFILSSSIDPLLTVKILGVRHILQQDFSMVRELRDIVRMIEGVLGLESGDVRSALGDLSSLVEIKDNMATLERNTIFFQHSSFQDFLLNKERSKEYSLDVLESHRVTAQWILRAFPRAGPRASQIIPDAVDLHVHLLKLSLTAELKHDIESFSFHDYLETQLERLEKAGQTANLNLIRDRLTKDFFGTLTYLCQSSELHDHHSNLFIDDITASVNRHPSAEKFHLLSTIWFVLQKPLKSYPSTELSVKIARQIFELHRVWEALCATLCGLDSADVTWDRLHYHLLHHRDSQLAARFFLNPLGSLQGNADETVKHVPESVLSHRLARLTISCVQYLRHHAGSKKTGQKRFLRFWANKSRRSPWIQRWRARSVSPQYRRTRVWNNGKTRYVYETYRYPPSLRRLRQKFYSDLGRASTFYGKAHFKYSWTLDLLRRTLRVARRSDELVLELSQPFVHWPAPIIFPRRIKRVKVALDAYAKEVSQKSDGENNLVGLSVLFDEADNLSFYSDD